MITPIRPESHDDAVRRLAAKASALGVKLYRDPADGRYYASSVSCPETLHYLTGVSCDCAGFASHQRCTHHSVLLVSLGWVDGDPSPDPEPTPIVGKIVRCAECRGLGETQYTRGIGPHRFVYDWQTCSACRGRGVEHMTAEHHPGRGGREAAAPFRRETMHAYPSTPNDIDAFADMIRSALPDVIATATEQEIEQVEDRELVALTVAGEAAFEIDMSNGSSFQFTITQTRQATTSCEGCNEHLCEDELNDEALCPRCAENRETA